MKPSDGQRHHAQPAISEAGATGFSRDDGEGCTETDLAIDEDAGGVIREGEVNNTKS